MEYAEELIDVRRVYMDRGFFSGKIVNLMEENDWDFIMPARKTSRIKDILEEADGENIQRYELNGNEPARFNLVLREGKDGELKAFATNCPRMEILSYNLFDLYGRRWDIETGFRVQKNKFLPKTTSKNYNVRLFLFLFSELLYNCWMLINVRISLEKHEEIQEEKEITAKKFIHCLFEAFDEYG
jgi:IS4 transposase